MFRSKYDTNAELIATPKANRLAVSTEENFRNVGVKRADSQVLMYEKRRHCPKEVCDREGRGFAQRFLALWSFLPVQTHLKLRLIRHDAVEFLTFFLSSLKVRYGINVVGANNCHADAYSELVRGMVDANGIRGR